jgi:uncharacterized membrane protein
MQKMRLIIIAIFLLTPFISFGQEGTLLQDKMSTLKGQVIEVVSEERKNVPGTDVQSTYQTVRVEILDGEKKGRVITITDDYLDLKEGDKVLVTHNIRAEDKAEFYTISDSYRLPTLILFTVIFVVLVIAVGGWQGIRGLLSLAGSLMLIMYVLIPGILHGYSPVLVSMVVSSIIIVLGSYITHGFNKTTSSAVIGMIITIVITGLLAFWSVHATHLTGFGSEEALYLNLNSQGNIDIVGVLLSGIMIGLLGVLYDVAIGQAISVEELHKIAPHIPRRTIYLRALRMGREHIGALVNTLAIAYVGASLPLLLLFFMSETTSILTINREIFATEIIRTLIGSIGLVLAVPITTLLAVWIVVKVKESASPELIKIEQHAIEHANHKH